MQRLMAAGFLTILAGFALLFAGAASSGGASVGGVVFIGPVPIAFGSGRDGWSLALGSVIVGAAMLVGLLVWSLRFRHMKGD